MEPVSAVVMSGSGFRLTYFVGLIEGLLENEKNIPYTHCFGISGGALGKIKHVADNVQ